jgi:hypothetical protein
MLGMYRVPTQLVVSRVAFSSLESDSWLVSFVGQRMKLTPNVHTVVENEPYGLLVYDGQFQKLTVWSFERTVAVQGETFKSGNEFRL